MAFLNAYSDASFWVQILAVFALVAILELLVLLGDDRSSQLGLAAAFECGYPNSGSSLELEDLKTPILLVLLFDFEFMLLLFLMGSPVNLALICWLFMIFSAAELCPEGGHKNEMAALSPHFITCGKLKMTTLGKIHAKRPYAPVNLTKMAKLRPKSTGHAMATTGVAGDSKNISVEIFLSLLRSGV